MGNCDRRISHLCFALVAAWIFGIGACSTARTGPGSQSEDVPEGEVTLPEPTAPPFAALPHPVGYQLSDIGDLFLKTEAPTLASLSGCDGNFQKLQRMTQSQSEIALGAREMVRIDPVRYHWCFYGKIINLENSIKQSAFIDEKQDLILKAYSFLTPIARAFFAEYRESRYLRWGVHHYRGLSEAIFYRSLELSREGTAELVEASEPFAFWRAPASNSSVLEKYRITEANEAASAVTPVATPSLTVASPSPVPASASTPPTAPLPMPTTP